MTQEQLNQFAVDLANLCNGDYTLNDGTKVRGNSFSYVTSQMRVLGWRNLSYYNLTETAKRCGFKMSRGRGLRIYHGGVMKLGVECDVFHKA